MMAPATGTKATESSHATGTHRLDCRSPVGNRTNRNEIMHRPMSHVQLLIHAHSRPAGRDPGSTTSECTLYAVPNTLIASAEPVTRNSQPIRLSGRLHARRIPMPVPAMFTNTFRTLAKLQLSEAAAGGSVVPRSTNMRARAATIMAIETVPIDHASRDAVLAFIVGEILPGHLLRGKGAYRHQRVVRPSGKRGGLAPLLGLRLAPPPVERAMQSLAIGLGGPLVSFEA